VVGQIARTGACSYSSGFHEVADAASYQKSLSVDVGLAVGARGLLWSASFSASVDYQNTEAGTRSDDMVYVYSAARCEVYMASLSWFGFGSKQVPFNLTSNFRQYVAALPTEVSDATMPRLLAFVAAWGTHFTTVGSLGLALLSLLLSLLQLRQWTG
jgi:hypothetical protein